MRQDQRWRRHLVKLIPTREGGTFVDVATGTGDVVLQVSQKRPEYAQFWGVDISDGMLSQAREKIRRAKAPIKLQNMSACEMKYADESIDCLTISFGLRNVKDKPLAMREFMRCLKPGGKLIVLEFFQASETVSQKLFQFYFKHILPRIGGMISDRAAYEYLPRSVGKFYTIRQMQALAQEIGFENPSTREFLFGTCGLIEFVKPT